MRRSCGLRETSSKRRHVALCQVPRNDSPRTSPAGISAFRVAGQGTESTVCGVLPQCAYMRIINVILSERASRAQDYLASHTKRLDKIRCLWTTIAQRREALMVCLAIWGWHHYSRYHLLGSQFVLLH